MRIGYRTSRGFSIYVTPKKNKHNRWIHKPVIEASATANRNSPNIDQTGRATRPIIEFEKNIELYNFGTKGVDAVEIAAFDNTKAEVVGRPNGGVIDGVTLEIGNRI